VSVVAICIGGYLGGDSIQLCFGGLVGVRVDGRIVVGCRERLLGGGVWLGLGVAD